MDIRWHGFSCFSFSGKNATVITDPYKPEHAGLKLPKMQRDVVLTNDGFPFHHELEGLGAASEHVFDWSGEYEAKGVNVTAIPAFDRPRSESEKSDKANRVLLFIFEIDGFKICHLSNLGHKLTPEMIEMIGDVDILLVPVGGNGVCLDAEKAHEVIEQLEPRMVIPMYYAVPGAKIKLSPLDNFLKEVGLKSPRKESVLKLKERRELPEEHTEYVVLEPTLK